MENSLIYGHTEYANLHNKARGLFIRSAKLFTAELKEAFYVRRALDGDVSMRKTERLYFDSAVAVILLLFLTITYYHSRVQCTVIQI